MIECPFCKSRNTLRRGLRPTSRDRRYMAYCLHCGSVFSVPHHVYFPLYNSHVPLQQATAGRRPAGEFVA